MRRRAILYLALICLTLTCVTWSEAWIIAQEAPTPTAGSAVLPTLTTTNTPAPIWPTDTPTPTVTWTPMPDCRDSYGDNDSPASGPVLAMNQALGDLTLFPQGNVDFFQLWGKGGIHYQVTTHSGEGVDTRLRVFDPLGNLIAENDDYQTGSPTSQVRFQALGDGWFSIAVDSGVPTDWGCRRYKVTAVDVTPPTATATKTPKPRLTATRTPPPTTIPAAHQPDMYEPNWDFERAANIGIGQSLKLNFNPDPPGSNAVDNDFFRLYVKVGQRLQIETQNLAVGLDTNIILYREDRSLIMGNDDCAPSELRSCLEWTPNLTGLIYILVGPVGTIPEATAGGVRDYTLTVTDQADQPTATPTRGVSQPQTPSNPANANLPWAVTPLPPTTWPTSIPAATATPQLITRPLGGVAVTATPAAYQPIAIEINLYYDENDNKAPDPSEGLAGVSIRILDDNTNQRLGHLFSDSRGHAKLMVSAQEAVRVSIPYLSYNERITPPGDRITIRLSPLALPSLIP